MSDTLDAISALISLILITVFAWAFYSLLVMIILAGLFTIVDVIAQYVMVGIPLPDWWKITWVISGVVGALEFYDNIVKGT